jgi:hypothetical protein
LNFVENLDDLRIIVGLAIEETEPALDCVEMFIPTSVRIGRGDKGAGRARIFARKASILAGITYLSCMRRVR